MEMSKENQALEAVKDYMIKQNRPYSVLDVVNNLHSQFGKTLVSKCLDSLVDSKDLKQKTLSKQKIYFPNQDNFPSFDQAELTSLDCEIQKQSEKLKETQEYTKRLESELKKVDSSLSTAELKIKMKELQEECERLGKKLENMKGSSEKVDPKEMEKICHIRESYRGHWRKRKRMANDILNTILENCPKKKKDLIEEVGIETDEDANVQMV